MDKPVTLSVKAWLIRQMSVRTMIQENILETVINHQFESSLIAIDTCNSIEFSGWGKFFFNMPKAVKKLEKYKMQIEYFSNALKDTSLTEIKRRNTEIKLQGTIKWFEYLNKKVNGNIESLGRLEEQPDSPKGIEGTDSEGERGENVDMLPM